MKQSNMTPKREYSLLPQGDDFHHHVREGESGATTQYFCFFILITLVIFFILAGLVTLTATMFYSKEITTTFGRFWYKSESFSGTPAPNTTTTARVHDSSATSWPSGGGSGSRNGTKHDGSTSPSSLTHHQNSEEHSGRNRTHHQHHHHNSHHFQGNHSVDSGESHHSHSRHNSTASSNGTLSNSSEESDRDGMDSEEENTLKMEDFKERFAETMRDIEKRMENITGIRRAEFVVPIFMLICFLSLFSVISLCCCVMMKRRDNRRRKLFGKLITDLQTGDSKTVLLNHSDLDD